MKYALLYVADGSWAVFEVGTNDRAVMKATTNSFPANEAIDEVALHGWYEADFSPIVGARHQLAWHIGGLEDAIVKVQELADFYSRTDG